MFKFVLRLLFIQATLLSQNTYHMEDLVLIRFITAFKDEKTIDNWMNATNKIALCEQDLFKDIINKVCSVLNMMATEREIDMKPLFMKTDISLKNIVYPYYETFIVISSVKRILFLNDTKSEAWNENNLPKDILYKEFYMIYISLRLTTEQIWFRYNYTDLSMSYLELKNIKDSKLEDKKTTEDLFKRINFTKISTGFLDSLFPTLKDTPVFVEAHKDGFRKSRKCIDKEILFDIRDGSKEFFEESMLRYLKQYSIKQSSKTIYKLRKHMDTQFSCNKTAAKVIVMLFHYLSEIKGKNTRYEISLQENNKYRIKWSYSKKPSLKAVKKYIMQQEIQDPCSIKKFNGIGPIGEYKTNYYTVKTNDNKNKGIETRLIVLSCGHQLGFDLIDKFLRNFYMNYSERLQCPTCKCFISILGSYDAIVYKCNENSSFCAII